MYSHNPLDSPAPPSLLRRPWSPEQNDDPASHSLQYHHNDAHYQLDGDDYDSRYPLPRSTQRRDQSDPSVEALDLADYAQTLQRQQQHNSISCVPESYSARPFMHGLPSRDSLTPPSLVSRDTLSSSTSGPSRYSSRQQTHKPFSLPAPSQPHSNPPSSNNPYGRFDAGRPSPQVYRSSNPEIDIAQFPSWSQDWYHQDRLASHPEYPSNAAFSPKSSPFNPNHSFHHNSYPATGTDSPHDPYAATDSERDLLPWNNDLPSYERPLDSSLKEERLRMLEHEFGSSGKTGHQPDFVDEGGKGVVGSVDEKGKLITQGPRKRIAVRVLQIILSLVAAIPAIYAAVVIKPKETPPPSGKPAAYVLYVTSCITFLALFGLFVLRPCCFRRKSKFYGPQTNNGMMVMPIQSFPGGKPNKKGKKNGKGSDVQVNLIVDPTMFQGRNPDEGELSDSDENLFSRRPRRRGIVTGLAMEEDWKVGRSWLKKCTAFDCVGVVVWAVVFVFILIGKRCPTGGFEGWCNAYNTSSAAACILCAAFGLHLFFDVKDMHASKVSPRTRS